MGIQKSIKRLALVCAFIFPVCALADPVLIVIDEGENHGNGASDGLLGGYAMTPFADPVAPD